MTASTNKWQQLALLIYIATAPADVSLLHVLYDVSCKNLLLVQLRLAKLSSKTAVK